MSDWQVSLLRLHAREPEASRFVQARLEAFKGFVEISSRAESKNSGSKKESLPRVWKANQLRLKVAEENEMEGYR